MPRNDGYATLSSIIYDNNAHAVIYLMDRHGPMVLAVCHFSLRKRQDVEDAFQNTFLALARGAGTIERRDTSDPPDRSLVSALREEVNRLPERYRLPVVRDYLDGKTNEEAATQLRCPLGTIK